MNTHLCVNAHAHPALPLSREEEEEEEEEEEKPKSKKGGSAKKGKKEESEEEECVAPRVRADAPHARQMDDTYTLTPPNYYCTQG